LNPSILTPLGVAFAGAGGALWLVRRKGLHRWLGPYLASLSRRRAPRPGDPVHVLLCIADHFEPAWRRPDPIDAQACVLHWASEYPRLFGSFRDSDGRAPQHTFFYPVEQYRAEHLDELAGLCRAGYGEVEIQLHHDNDTADNLRRRLRGAKGALAQGHGLLSRDSETGDVVYGFVHGNWALDNARCDGRWCGVNNELDVLRETGCYADFTLPSAPSETQTRTINSIYWAVDDPQKPKSHDGGLEVGTVSRPGNSLLMIQGPLLLNWNQRKYGLLPRIENACIQGNQPPTMERLDLWLRAQVRVPERPDWYFVKLHTHGAAGPDMAVVLGSPMADFHHALRARARADPAFRYHYVTAREMANLALAAAAGWRGTVEGARDFRYVPLWRHRDTEVVPHSAACSSCRADAAHAP
jgi:hypothetical protein